MARDEWSALESVLFTEVFADPGEWNDKWAEGLFHAGYFDMNVPSDERIAIREALDNYLSDVYDIDFQEEFDWRTWRENYE